MPPRPPSSHPVFVAASVLLVCGTPFSCAPGGGRDGGRLRADAGADEPIDGGATPDAAAGEPPLHAPDAGRPVDGGVPRVDAGERDAGAGDAGVRDAGWSAEGGRDAGFVHPGLLHGADDFERMRRKVDAGASPWAEGWQRLTTNVHADPHWTPHPLASVHRNDGMNPDNFMTLAHDVVAAYTCALVWQVSGDVRFADKAIEIMNGWSAQLQEITWSDGHYDGSLVAGLQGYQFANAGEIMRSYAGWKREDFARFQSMMMNVFANRDFFLNHKASSVAVYANWDLAAMLASMSVAVLADDRALFDAVIAYFHTGLGNGALVMAVPYVHAGYFGQLQEAGRDQGHATLAVGLLGALAETAWHQGVDLYAADNNRVLAAAEYVARGNLLETASTYYAMPFAPYDNGSGVQTAFATGSQGIARPEWTLFWNHYGNRRGLSAPHCRRFMEQTAPEGGGGNYGGNSGGFDLLGFGTLTFSREPYAGVEVPTGLTAQVVDGRIVLSWWGTASATRYTVHRSAVAGGPYAPIATGLGDLRTYTDAPGAGTFSYVVTATTPAGETAPSSEVRATTDVVLHTWLTFEEDGGTVARDATGHGHDGRLLGGVGRAAGKSGMALAFDGTDGAVSLPDGLLTELSDFTFAAWVNAESRGWSRIFDFGTGLGQYMFLVPGAQTIYSITGNTRVGEQRISSATQIPLQQWTHVAVTLRGHRATLYIDGAVVGENPEMWLSPRALGRTTQNWLGRSQYASDPAFKGRLDDVRIYSGALTSAEVAALARP